LATAIGTDDRISGVQRQKTTVFMIFITLDDENQSKYDFSNEKDL
jgi:hypothetical protein